MPVYVCNLNFITLRCGVNHWHVYGVNETRVFG
jgi:hypothetical protein